MDHEQRLIEGLVLQRHGTLYLDNPWFRQGIDTLARLLPYFVDGLAADAEAKNAAMQRDIRLIEQGLPLSPRITP